MTAAAAKMVARAVRRYAGGMRPLPACHVLLTTFAVAALGCGHAHATSSGIDYRGEPGPVSAMAAPADEASPAESNESSDAEASAPLAKSLPMRRMASAADTAEPRRGGAQARVAAPAPAGHGDEKMVIDGALTLRTADVEAVTRDVRAHAGEVGAVVVGDTVSVTADGVHAVLRLRLPPNQAVAFADWLGQRATLVSRHLQAADVSRQFVDQEVAIKNLQITIDRLRELAQRPNGALNDVLAVERELTRVRGELEAIEGQHRVLQDQVARATLTVTILPTRTALPPTPPVAAEPELKFELMPFATLWHFLDDRPGRGQTRGGGGVSLMFARAFSLDFTFLPQHQADRRAYLFGLSVAGYSDFLGGGRRRFLNPYLGLRVGAGSIDDHGAFLFGGEVGVELVRYKLFLVDLTGRALGVIHGHNVPNDVALQGVLGVGVPF